MPQVNSLGLFSFIDTRNKHNMIILIMISIVGLATLIMANIWIDSVSTPNRIERPISTIGFIAKVPLKDEPLNKFLIEERHCSWRLGIGSCGRVAESLRLSYEGDMLIITQTCADGDYKEFHYKIGDVIGRITISYKSVSYK